jgi:hypothetical protein
MFTLSWSAEGQVCSCSGPRPCGRCGGCGRHRTPWFPSCARIPRSAQQPRDRAVERPPHRRTAAAWLGREHRLSEAPWPCPCHGARPSQRHLSLPPRLVEGGGKSRTFVTGRRDFIGCLRKGRQGEGILYWRWDGSLPGARDSFGVLDYMRQFWFSFFISLLSKTMRASNAASFWVGRLTHAGRRWVLTRPGSILGQLSSC